MSSPSSSLNDKTSNISNVRTSNAQLPSFDHFLETVGLDQDETRRSDDKSNSATNGRPSFRITNARESRIVDTVRELRPLPFVSAQRVDERRRRAQSCPEYLEGGNIRADSMSSSVAPDMNGITSQRIEGDNHTTANDHGSPTRRYATTSRSTNERSTHVRGDRSIAPRHYVPSTYYPQVNGVTPSSHPYPFYYAYPINYAQPYYVPLRHQIGTDFRDNVESNVHPTQSPYATHSTSMTPSNLPSNYAHESSHNSHSPNRAGPSNRIYHSSNNYASCSARSSGPHHHERSEATDRTRAPRASEVWGARPEDERRCSCSICSRIEPQGHNDGRLNDTASELPRVPISLPASSSTSALLTSSNTQHPRRAKRSRNRSSGGVLPAAKKRKVFQLRPAQALYSETNDGKFICRYIGPACPKSEGCFTPCSDSRSLARHLRRHAKWEVKKKIPEEERVVWNGMPEELLWQNLRCRLPDDELMKCKYYRDKKQRWTSRTLDRYENAMKVHDAENH